MSYIDGIEEGEKTLIKLLITKEEEMAEMRKLEIKKAEDGRWSC